MWQEVETTRAMMDSVHILYNPDLDKLDTLPKMLAPRVDFSLHFPVNFNAVHMISCFKFEQIMSIQKYNYQLIRKLRYYVLAMHQSLLMKLNFYLEIMKRGE